MTGHDRAYRALLRLYPATFRDDYGEEMARLFGEQLRDARAARGRHAVAGLWTRAIADVLETAPRHHLRKENRVPEPIPAGTSSAVVSVRTPSRSGPRVLLGLLPLWVLLIFALAAPAFLDPMFANPPAIAGLPAGVLLIVVAITLMLAGVWLLRRSESDLGTVVAFLFFTIPALALILIGPAIILVLTNLAIV
jgi:hypothetical protein